MAPPPKQTKTDAVMEEAAAAPSSTGPQEETPMEQDTPEGKDGSEPQTEDAGTKEEIEDAKIHAKMPEHPGRDSDDEDEDTAEEQEK